jgi:predicted PhzF superfamily epimerase YddE/YHI9
MGSPIHIVDAFADAAFAGNPAAICLLESNADPEWMQRVAAEMNLSETAFVQVKGDAHHLRWFTPTTEVDLCGHATLATAHILWEIGILDQDTPARFDTRSGRLTATRADDWIELDFPAAPAEEVDLPVALADGLDSEPRWTGRNQWDYLVELDGEGVVRGLAPDFARLMALNTRGIIVTARSETKGIDFVSRFFAPRAGIDEDPVTGSAHCALAPYWGDRLGRDRLEALQVSRRGGHLKLSWSGDRVGIAGRAVTVLTGELRT